MMQKYKVLFRFKLNKVKFLLNIYLVLFVKIYKERFRFCEVKDTIIKFGIPLPEC